MAAVIFESVMKKADLATKSEVSNLEIRVTGKIDRLEQRIDRKLNGVALIVFAVGGLALHQLGSHARRAREDAHNAEERRTLEAKAAEERRTREAKAAEERLAGLSLVNLAKITMDQLQTVHGSLLS